MSATLAVAALLICGCNNSTTGNGPAPARAGGATGSGPGNGTGGIFSNGGNSGSGGSAGSAGSPGQGSSGGASGQGTLPPVNESGMATVKFCNLVGTSTGDLTFKLELGSKKVTLMAKTGECAPAKGMPCAVIPAGDIPVSMYEGTDELLRGILTVTPDKPMAILAGWDMANNRPTLDARGIKPEFKCEDVELGPAMPPPDGGAPDTGSGPKPPPRI